MTKTSGLSILTRTDEQVEAIIAGFNERVRDNITGAQHYQISERLRKYSAIYCERCFQTGTVIEYEHYTDHVRLTSSDCQCKKLKRVTENVQHGMELAGIPVRYHRAAIGDWEDPSSNIEEKRINSRSITIVKGYAGKLLRMQKKGYGLFFCGPNGVGKTYLACAIGANCIREGLKLCYYTMPKIVQTVIGGWYEKELQQTISDIEMADFLIIDDLDKAYATKTRIEISVLDNLFRERLQNNRPMLVTSNRTLDQVRESHGESVFSMFNEHCAEVVLLGNDHRKKLAESMVKDILSS